MQRRNLQITIGWTTPREAEVALYLPLPLPFGVKSFKNSSELSEDQVKRLNSLIRKLKIGASYKQYIKLINLRHILKVCQVNCITYKFAKYAEFLKLKGAGDKQFSETLRVPNLSIKLCYVGFNFPPKLH